MSLRCQWLDQAPSAQGVRITGCAEFQLMSGLFQHQGCLQVWVVGVVIVGVVWSSISGWPMWVGRVGLGNVGTLTWVRSVGGF